MTDEEAARVAVELARLGEENSRLWRVVRIAREYPLPGKLAKAIRLAEAQR